MAKSKDRQYNGQV